MFGWFQVSTLSFLHNNSLTSAYYVIFLKGYLAIYVPKQTFAYQPSTEEAVRGQHPLGQFPLRRLTQTLKQLRQYIQFENSMEI